MFNVPQYPKQGPKDIEDSTPGSSQKERLNFNREFTEEEFTSPSEGCWTREEVRTFLNNYTSPGSEVSNLTNKTYELMRDCEQVISYLRDARSVEYVEAKLEEIKYEAAKANMVERVDYLSGLVSEIAQMEFMGPYIPAEFVEVLKLTASTIDQNVENTLLAIGNYETTILGALKS